MATNAILATLSHLVACSPCAGTFGRWKANLQDDDADLWNDLTLVNAIPEVKPPDIPKVVEVISCSDGSDEDVSTLAYESSYHHHSSSPHRHYYPKRNHNSTRREEEKSFTPSPKRSDISREEGKGHSNSSRYHDDHDAELEQVLEEIGLEDESQNNNKNDGDGDAELESIMGPRSQISMARSHISRSIRRASSAPAVARLPSLLQQHQRERFQSKHETLMRYHSDSPSASKEHSDDDQECRDNFDDEVPLPSSPLGQMEEEEHHDFDGSSYSSACHKISFFRKTRNSLFRSSGSSIHGYKKAGANGGWLPLDPSGSSTEDTVSSSFTKSKSSMTRSNSRLKFKGFH